MGQTDCSDSSNIETLKYKTMRQKHFIAGREAADLDDVSGPTP